MPRLLEELFVIRWLQQLVSNVAAADYVRRIDTRKLEVEFKKEIIALNPQTSFSALENLAANVENIRENVNISFSVITG